MSDFEKPSRKAFDANRTQHAQLAFDVAQLFVARFGKDEVSGYVPTMREPSGVSTGGGRQALQHIVLESKTPGESAVTVGQVNLVAHAGKLRTHDCLRQLHVQRFGQKPFALDAAAYQVFFDQAHRFLLKYSLAMVIEATPSDAGPSAESRRVGTPAPTAKSSPFALVGIALLVILAAGFAILKLTHKL